MCGWFLIADTFRTKNIIQKHFELLSFLHFHIGLNLAILERTISTDSFFISYALINLV